MKVRTLLLLAFTATLSVSPHSVAQERRSTAQSADGRVEFSADREAVERAFGVFCEESKHCDVREKYIAE
jgi:hypothetical protein